MIRLYNRGIRTIIVDPKDILAGHVRLNGNKSGHIPPERIVDVTDEMGKKILKLYPDEFRDLSEKPIETALETENKPALGTVPNPGSIDPENTESGQESQNSEQGDASKSVPPKDDASVIEEARIAISQMNLDQLGEFDAKINDAGYPKKVKSAIKKLSEDRLNELSKA